MVEAGGHVHIHGAGVLLGSRCRVDGTPAHSGRVGLPSEEKPQTWVLSHP